MKFKVGDSVKLVGQEDETIRTVVGYTDMGVRYRNEGRGYHITCAENELELRQPKFKPGDHVKPKAEFANDYITKSGWEILEINGSIVKYKYRCEGWYAVDSCPIDLLELESSKAEVEVVPQAEPKVDYYVPDLQVMRVGELIHADWEKRLKRSEGTWDIHGSIYMTETEPPTTWTFRGDLDYVKLRDDMIEANADWAIVDDVVYVRGRIKHTMDVLGIRGAVKVCRGLWETGIYHEVARTGRFDEMLQELANRPTHTVEVFRLEEPTK